MVGSPKGCIHIHITTVVAADRSWTGKERRAISQTYKPFQDIHTIYTRSCHPIDRVMSRLQLLLKNQIVVKNLGIVAQLNAMIDFE